MNEDEKELILAQDKAQDKAQDEIVNEKISNMNEEEKEAIAFLRFYVSDIKDEYFDRDYHIDKNFAETILNLIEKQQVIIDSLNFRIVRQEDCLKELQKLNIKDKVKEILKELENYNFKGNFDDIDFIQSIIQQFKELLGE